MPRLQVLLFLVILGTGLLAACAEPTGPSPQAAPLTIADPRVAKGPSLKLAGSRDTTRRGDRFDNTFDDAFDYAFDYAVSW